MTPHRDTEPCDRTTRWRLFAQSPAAWLILSGAAGCDAPQLRPRPIAVEDPPAQPCEAADRRIAPGVTARVCVLIGRTAVVRLEPVGEVAEAIAEVCNRSDVQRARLAWSPADRTPGASRSADALWAAEPSRRRALAAGECAQVGPAAAVVLRGYFDGRQGYDIAADWQGTVTFRPAS